MAHQQTFAAAQNTGTTGGETPGASALRGRHAQHVLPGLPKRIQNPRPAARPFVEALHVVFLIR